MPERFEFMNSLAITSLPLPVSPVTSTFTSSGAICLTVLNTASMDVDANTTPADVDVLSFEFHTTSCSPMRDSGELMSRIWRNTRRNVIDVTIDFVSFNGKYDNVRRAASLSLKLTATTSTEERYRRLIVSKHRPFVPLPLLSLIVCVQPSLVAMKQPGAQKLRACP